jgi:hypothetical protein
MKRPRAVSVIASLLIAAAGLAGIAVLFELRFAAGDVYPRYSSLRSDPVGVRALYESLARLPGLTVERSFVPIERRRGTHATVFYLGATLPDLSAEKSELRLQLEKTAARGNYVVVSLAPFSRNPDDKSPLAIAGWDLPIEQAKSDDGDGPLSFGEGKNWTVVYRERAKTVVVERAFGNGALALAATTYPFLNQALAENRRTELLVRLVGAHTRVVFDEAHFGVVEQGSLAELARRYRLGGLVAGLLLLAALAIWKESAGFPPAWEGGAASAGPVAGRDSLSGFSSLLRRNVPPRKLMELGWSEWKRTHGRELKPGDAAAVESILAAETDPLLAYAKSRGYLSERKRI